MAGVLLLASPVFMAFRSGGYGVKSQLIVAGLAGVLLAVVALAAPWPPLPRGLPLLALGSLAGYALWTGLSTGWARILDRAVHDTDRAGMYVAAFALAIAVMRLDTLRQLVPEALLAGILVVSVYALAGRFLPHLVHERVNSARLSQPLTYWNSLGMFAGFGTILGVAVAGDLVRPLRVRAAACAAAVPCGLASYLTLSRGAAASVVAGLVVCVALRRGRSTLLAAGCALLAVVVLAATLDAFPEVLSLHGDTSKQASQGAAFLPIAVVVTVLAGLGFARLAQTPAAKRELPFGGRGRAVLAAATVPVVLGLAIAVAGQGTERTAVPTGASRITRVETNRGHYWRVALDAFRRHPLDGVGSGGFAGEWAKHRGRDQSALDAHSIYVETAAELGIVGALLLAAFLASVGTGAVRVARTAPLYSPVAAALGVLAAFAVHVGLDWDWEMPAVSLVALIMAAVVLRTPGVARRRPRMSP